MEANQNVVVLQSIEIDKETTEQFLHDLLVSKTEIAKEAPAGLLFSIGGFKLEATKPTF
jgi:hypothetical protein